MKVLRSIPAPAQALLGSNALAHVVTLNPDGTPQVSVVWCGVRDEQVLFCTEADTAKVRNIRRNPRVVLSIEDEARNAAGTQQHLVIQGDATVLGPADKELCDELCRVYAGRPDHDLNLRSSPTAVTVAVDVQRIGGNGPWTEPAR
ncbi:PPOX class F420-dependent oxidoreductase [Dermatobacter hominis]|uniref:PPOX class F420-dependent oxidoreductase n=1 Tax=Dermatobacter hominis TaxID=2884263 RepID=UPI001D116774|nr:PPOX class F420-dependent oxidoreductase [Dermatobacter hominis]UDY37594.1 PPOX class F420-dependent oxidoreductase [Dermatobacter hominis]